MTIQERLEQAEQDLKEAVKEEASKEKLLSIPLAKIIRDKKLQPRVQIKTERVEEYAELTEHQPEKLPPIKAFYETSIDSYWVWDGWTRIAAREHLNQPLYVTSIPALVRPGTREDAIVAAAAANAEHGEPRTREDQQRAIWNLLSEVSSFRKKSDREIARACALGEHSGHKQVARIYHKMVEAGELPARDGDREGADGKSYPAKKAVGSMTQLEEPPTKQASLLITDRATAGEQAFNVFEQADKGKPPLRNADRPLLRLHETLQVLCLGYQAQGREVLIHLPGNSNDRTLEQALKDLPDSLVATDPIDETGGAIYHQIVERLPTGGTGMVVCTILEPNPPKRQEAPKVPAGFCHCGKRAFSGKFCTEHTYTAAIAGPREASGESTHSPSPTEEEARDSKESRAEWNEKQAASRTAKHTQIAAEAKAAQKEGQLGPFTVLLADPPWQYTANVSESKAIEKHYPTLSLEALCALNIASLCAPKAVLYLWVTAPLALDAGEVIKAWGFSYKTQYVWHKDNGHGMGHWVRGNHELLYVCTRGGFPTPHQEDRTGSVIHSPRTRHSEKPAWFRQHIEELYPDHPKVELFARERAEGWTSLGNEIDGRDIREVLSGDQRQRVLPVLAKPSLPPAPKEEPWKDFFEGCTTEAEIYARWNERATNKEGGNSPLGETGQRVVFAEFQRLLERLKPTKDEATKEKPATTEREQALERWEQSKKFADTLHAAYQSVAIDPYWKDLSAEELAATIGEPSAENIIEAARNSPPVFLGLYHGYPEVSGEWRCSYCKTVTLPTNYQLANHYYEHSIRQIYDLLPPYTCWKCEEVHPVVLNEWKALSCAGCKARLLLKDDHLCKACKTLWVTKAALKQHECEPPNDWLERGLKGFLGLTTQEEVTALFEKLTAKATTEAEQLAITEAWQEVRNKLPHAENGRSPRQEKGVRLVEVWSRDGTTVRKGGHQIGERPLSVRLKGDAQQAEWQRDERLWVRAAGWLDGVLERFSTAKDRAASLAIFDEFSPGAATGSEREQVMKAHQAALKRVAEEHDAAAKKPPTKGAKGPQCKNKQGSKQCKNTAIAPSKFCVMHLKNTAGTKGRVGR